MNITFFETIRFAWHYFFHLFPWRMILIMTLVIIGVVLELSRPFVLGSLIDFIAKTPQDSVASSLPKALFLVFLLHGVIGFLRQNFSSLAWRMWSFVQSHVMANAQMDGFIRVSRYETEWHQNTFVGSTIRKIGRGVRALESFSDLLMFNFFNTTLITIGMLVTVGLRSPMLSFVMASGMIVFVVVSAFLATRVVLPMRQIANDWDTRNGAAIADAIAGNAAIKSFGAENFEDDRFGHNTESWRKALLAGWYAQNWAGIVQQNLLLLLSLAIVGGAVWLWGHGLFSIGDVTFAILNLQILWGSFNDIGRNIREISQAQSDLADLIIIKKTEPRILDVASAPDLVVSKGEIVWDHVDFCYPKGKEKTYDGLSVFIKSGEHVALVGASGSGKSTFVKLLQRLYDIADGAITIDGQNIAEVTQESLRQAISLVPQEPILFHRSVAENIAYGKPKASMKEIIAAAKKAKAHEFIEKLPLGYETLVGERGIKLSGGERQRVAIARAILANSPILVFDEATSSLDSISEHAIQEALEYLMKGRTTIVVAHRLSTIKKVDRILVFDNGKIVEEGSHSALLKKENGIYRKLYEMQSGGFLGSSELKIVSDEDLDKKIEIFEEEFLDRKKVF